MSILCLSRQPIIDRDNTVVGYALTYRDPDNSDAARTDPVGTLHGLMAAMTHIGKSTVSRNMPSFINLTADTLCLPEVTKWLPQGCVVELDNTSDYSPRLFEAVAHIKDAGFKIALDAFEPTPANEHFVSLADIIKLDVNALSPEEVRHFVATLAEEGTILLAEHVQDCDLYAFSHSLPFEYFQGYFCGKIEVLAKPRVLH